MIEQRYNNCFNGRYYLGLLEIVIISGLYKHRSREAGLGITPKGLRASVDLALAGGGGITPKGLRALAASVVSGFGGFGGFGGLGITPKGLRALAASVVSGFGGFGGG